MPAILAEVAALILKLCVLYLELSKPARLSVAESKVLNRNLVNGVPSSKENKDPRVLPRIARYGSRALTGHTTDSVQPKHRLIPKGGGTGGARGAKTPFKCFKRGLSPPNTNIMQY